MNFDLTYSFMIPMLEMFAKATHSYGWAIVGLTLLVRLICWPLVAKQTHSMQAMSKLQPKLKELQAQYKDDQQLYQQKMMEFYKQNKINPAGGCLPMLIQLPILFALFGTFTGPPFGDKPIDVKINVVAEKQAPERHQNEVSGGNSPYVSREDTTAKVVVFPGDSTVVLGDTVDFGVRAIQGELPPNFKVYWRVFGKGEKEPLRLKPLDADVFRVKFTDLGEMHVTGAVPGIAKNEPFLFIHSLGKVAKGADLLKPENYDTTALILLFGLTMFLSTKFSGAGPTGNDDEMTEQQKVQRDSMKVMPLTVTAMFFFIPLPTGVYLYMVVSNVMQTLQTFLIMKTSNTQLVDVSSDGTVTMTKNGDTYSAGTSPTPPLPKTDAKSKSSGADKNANKSDTKNADAKRNGGADASKNNGDAGGIINSNSDAAKIELNNDDDTKTETKKKKKKK